MPELPEGVERFTRAEIISAEIKDKEFVRVFDLPAILAAERERWEGELETVRRRLSIAIDKEHQLQAELEALGQDWSATKLSYCTGGLVNLRAALDVLKEGENA